MSRLYLSAIIGDGNPRSEANPQGNPYRPKAMEYPSTWLRALEIPTAANGRPPKVWALAEIEATDLAPFDADPDITLIEDRMNLDVVPTAGQRNRINNMLSRLGLTARVAAGQSYRQIANVLLAELGATARL